MNKAPRYAEYRATARNASRSWGLARYRVNTVLSMHMSNFNFGVIIFLIVIDED
jgi:hypothetical protein